ncbi:MAG: hypothetical protein ACI9YU_001372 [Flavobacteriales bacterium]|jgi:hypothetical protein
MKKRSKAILQNLAVSLFATILAISIGETGTRLYAFGGDAFNYEKVNSFDNAFQSGIAQTSDIKGLEYELVPSLDIWYKLTPFRTNKFGLRDDACTKYRKYGVRRIAIIGDSFTMGTGVAQNQLYHTIVENKLNAGNDTIGYELLNFGVSGYNLNKYEIQLKETVIDFKPDEVVIGFCAYNDHYLPDKSPKIDSIPAGTTAKGFWEFYFKRLIKLRFFMQHDVQKLKYEKEHLQYIEERFNGIRQFCEEKKIRVSVIYLSNLYKPKEASQIELISKNMGFKFVDTSCYFKKKDIAHYSVNVFDTHPNDKANKIFGAALFNLLKND